MLETKNIFFAGILASLLILLPACQTTKKPYAIQPRKPQTILVNADTPQNYKERKETIKKKLKVKKKMHDELPSRIKDMNEQELIKGKEYALELGYTEYAIKHLERLVVITEDPALLKQGRLELADLYFELGEFEKAGKLYAQYLEYYPGSEQREYVEYKTILCRFYLTLQTDRDQTNTKETLALAHNYLEKTDVYNTYVTDVQEIQHASYLKLVESEKEIVAFYLRRNKFKAAENRLAYIKKQYLAHTPETEADILGLEIQLADAQGHAQIAQEKRIELANRFGQDEVVQLAQANKMDYVTKF